MIIPAVIAAAFLAVSTAINNVSIVTVPLGVQWAVVFQAIVQQSIED